MASPGPKDTPDPLDETEIQWDDDLELGSNIDPLGESDFQDDGIEDATDFPELTDLSGPVEMDLEWRDDDSEDGLNTALPLDDRIDEPLSITLAEPSDTMQDIVVLPWKTTGRVPNHDEDIAVQLDPSQPHSTWYTQNMSRITEGFTVQGLPLTVPFHKTKAETELVVLGRDALTHRILITASVAKDSSSKSGE